MRPKSGLRVPNPLFTISPLPAPGFRDQRLRWMQNYANHSRGGPEYYSIPLSQHFVDLLSPLRHLRSRNRGKSTLLVYGNVSLVPPLVGEEVYLVMEVVRNAVAHYGCQLVEVVLVACGDKLFGLISLLRDLKWPQAG